jgi:inner membrane protein
MPSPVGHSLIGLAIASACVLPRGPLRAVFGRLRQARGPLALGVLAANAPDVDYVPGILAGDLNAFHHLHTHTLGWVAAVALGAWMAGKGIGRMRGLRSLALVFVLLASHLAADLVTDDGRPPYGIMALWPLSDEYMISPVTVFWRLHKKDWSEFLQPHNFMAALNEAAWCLPLVAAAVVWRSRRVERGSVGA